MLLNSARSFCYVDNAFRAFTSRLNISAIAEDVPYLSSLFKIGRKRKDYNAGED
jgi:hypothetical protein